MRGPQISPITLQRGLKIADYEGPVIGVLGQNINRSISLLTNNAKTLSAKFSKYGNNYLPASYVRFVETSGNHDNKCSLFSIYEIYKQALSPFGSVSSLIS